VAELLGQRPGAVRVFLEHEIACLGCPFNVFDTLSEALAVHHIPADLFIVDLEKGFARSAPSPSVPSVAEGER
jgi:hybrid cluster-associated redox disulfide protein